MSQSVLKWVKLNQLSARLKAGGPCRAIVIPLFPVSGTQEALSLWAKGEKKKQKTETESFFKAAGTNYCQKHLTKYMGTAACVKEDPLTPSPNK